MRGEHGRGHRGRPPPPSPAFLPAPLTPGPSVGGKDSGPGQTGPGLGEHRCWGDLWGPGKGASANLGNCSLSNLL